MLIIDIFISNSKYVVYIYMTFAIAYGVEIYIERQPNDSDTRDNERKKIKLTYHCSFIRQWILA